MNSFKFKSFIIWGLVLLFIEIVLIFSYFNFSDKEIEVRDQLAQFFTTKTSEQNNFPVLKQNISELALSAESFISVFVANSGPASAKASADKSEKILVKKNEAGQLPIASITKLMTAVIALDKYKLDDVVMITENSLKVDSLSGIYKVGNQFFFYNALRAMLIASHNEIANTFACPELCRGAEKIGAASFIDSMNKKALELGLLNTKFANETGLDPVRSPMPLASADTNGRLTSNGVDPEIDLNYINHSTVYDIYKLAKYIEENNSDIFYITAQKEFDLFDIDKKFVGTIKNTNRLLIDQDIPFRIVGGKTGETDLAKQNLVVVAEAPCGGNIFNVILGSQNRFEDMKKILQYINDSYDWSCPNS